MTNRLQKDEWWQRHLLGDWCLPWKNSVKIKFYWDLRRHLQKAFDTLDHWILLNKLNHYSFQTTPLKWFHSYFKDHSQHVDYDGTILKICPITTDVPQGSILGLLLFIIYMNILARPAVNIPVNKIDIKPVRYHLSHIRITIVWSLWRHRQSIVTSSAERKASEWDMGMMCEDPHF